MLLIALGKIRADVVVVAFAAATVVVVVAKLAIEDHIFAFPFKALVLVTCKKVIGFRMHFVVNEAF